MMLHGASPWLLSAHVLAIRLQYFTTSIRIHFAEAGFTTLYHSEERRVDEALGLLAYMRKKDWGSLEQSWEL